MGQKLYESYVNILKEELPPAMGCTEPIAVAYASDKSLFDGAEKLIKEAFTFSDKKPGEKELIIDTIS